MVMRKWFDFSKKKIVRLFIIRINGVFYVDYFLFWKVEELFPPYLGNDWAARRESRIYPGVSPDTARSLSMFDDSIRVDARVEVTTENAYINMFTLSIFACNFSWLVKYNYFLTRRMQCRLRHQGCAYLLATILVRAEDIQLLICFL